MVEHPFLTISMLEDQRLLSQIQIFQKYENFWKNYGRLSVQEIANTIGISTRSAFTIKKSKLNFKKICAKWILHILTKEQKNERLKKCKKLLKMYNKMGHRQLSELVTGDGTWIHFFQPEIKIKNQVWIGKTWEDQLLQGEPWRQKRCFTQFFSMQTELSLSILFHKDSVSLQIRIHPTFCQNFINIIKKTPKDWIQRYKTVAWQCSGSAHKAKLTQEYLRRHKVVELPHPAYSPDLAPCNLFLCPKLKKLFQARRFQSRSALGSAVFQYLRAIPKTTYEKCFMSG